MFADDVVHGWLRETTNGVWMALHFSDPDVNGAYASEVFGGSYVRVQGIWTTPNSRATWNSNDFVWLGLPSILITHVAGWDAQYNGNYLFSQALPSGGVRVIAGKGFTLPSNTMALSIG